MNATLFYMDGLVSTGKYFFPTTIIKIVFSETKKMNKNFINIFVTTVNLQNHLAIVMFFKKAKKKIMEKNISCISLQTNCYGRNYSTQ